jgi:glutathione S-transferase
MYQLFIANKNYSSWSLRPWVLMRALAIAFEERLTPFGDGSNREAFRRFSPNGRVPCLHDGGTVVWDSLAIVEYLAERHTGVWPQDAAARTWARCAASEMHSGFDELRHRCSMTCGQRVKLRDIGVALQTDIGRINELWTEGPTRFGGPYLAGAHFSAADAFYAPVVFRAQTFGLPLAEGAGAYAQRMLRHPAMQAWYEAALAEPWREESHERAVAQAGEVWADYRGAAGDRRAPDE